jgi:hypothetical protein
MRQSRTGIWGALLLLAACTSVPDVRALSAEPATFGSFPEPPQTQWLEDGRRMILLRDFVFIDANKEKWIAPAAHRPPIEGDFTTDGASIPPVFWSLIGGPFEGKYRNAAIVHDAECTSPYKHKWQDVHRMFYRAFRAGGTDELTAKLMFAAVWHFGPRWQITGEGYVPRTLEREGDAKKLVAYIVRHPDISLGDIEGLSSDALSSKMTPEEYLKFDQAIQECNDPNGHNLGARGDPIGNHEYRHTMSTPPTPCRGF